MPPGKTGVSSVFRKMYPLGVLSKGGEEEWKGRLTVCPTDKTAKVRAEAWRERDMMSCLVFAVGFLRSGLMVI